MDNDDPPNPALLWLGDGIEHLSVVACVLSPIGLGWLVVWWLTR